MFSVTTLLILASLLVLGVSCSLQIFYALKIVPIFEKEPYFKEESFPVIDWAEPVSIAHPRGYQLRGSHYFQPAGTSRGLILFVPEFQASHYSAWKYCQGLYESGYEILAVNATGQGDSDTDRRYRPRFWVGQRECEDLNVVLSAIQNNPQWASEFVGIFGVSRGGGTGLAVVSRRPDIPLLIAEGAFANRQIIERAVRNWMFIVLPEILCRTLPFWHIIKTVELAQAVYQIKTRYWFSDPKPFAEGQKTRVLLISGAKDKYVPPEFAQDLVTRLAIPQAQVEVVPRANHNQARVVDPALYDQRLLSFLRGSSIADSAAKMPAMPMESSSAR